MNVPNEALQVIGALHLENYLLRQHIAKLEEALAKLQPKPEEVTPRLNKRND